MPYRAKFARCSQIHTEHLERVELWNVRPVSTHSNLTTLKSLCILSSKTNIRISYSFIHLAVCLTTSPKPLPKRALHIVRSRTSSFSWGYPLLSLRWSSSFLRLLPRLPVTSISPFIFSFIYHKNQRSFLWTVSVLWFLERSPIFILWVGTWISRLSFTNLTHSTLLLLSVVTLNNVIWGYSLW
jgi:hypothetical protein